MAIALFALETAMLIGGARLCWTTKSAPGAVNESTYIAMSMYLILFVCAVLFPIVYLNIDPSPAVLLMIMAVGFIIATIGCGLFMFGPKVMLLLEGADVNDKFEVVKQDDSTDPTTSANALQYVKKKIVNKLSDHSSMVSSRLSKQSYTAAEPTCEKGIKSHRVEDSSNRTIPLLMSPMPHTGRTVNHAPGIQNRIKEEEELSGCEKEGEDNSHNDKYQIGCRPVVCQSGRTIDLNGSNSKDEKEKEKVEEDVRVFSTVISKTSSHE
eukprot:CAMPEP_0182419424 /NCGR_PEP_ID=MMETSP1167-20130531/3896_1 /TAXON_ID=2988 /ORGANISM="Mallomonas Sp, Strain CCMP3275" /LENGTH=266 /DNA_ID=CAMNT_0024594359 /DNA_START=252 /DNA_END=1052 /DNA_ORIENTATION=-